MIELLNFDPWSDTTSTGTIAPFVILDRASLCINIIPGLDQTDIPLF